MYNEERKRQYLNEKSETAVIAQNLVNAFNDAAQMEEKYGRDLCEWTSEEIMNFYRYLSTSSVQRLVQLNSSLVAYTNWCLMNGLVSDNQNHFSELKTETLIRCADVKKLLGTVITREQLLDEISVLPNYVDRFIFLGLFEGIPVADDVMKNVKISDLDGDILHLSNGNNIVVSPELRHIMFQADEEKTSINMHPTKHIEIPYRDEDTIIKYKVGVGTENTTIMIGGRFRSCLKYLGLESMTMKTIRESGRIYMMRHLAEKYHITMEETITMGDIRKIHEKIFGKIQNSITYLNTYGKCF